MTKATHAAQRHCEVVGGEKLLARAGGATGLCARVESAILKQAPAANVRALIKVLPRSRFSAALVVNGQALPDQNFAVMDGEVNEGALERFAQSLGAAAAQAAKGHRK